MKNSVNVSLIICLCCCITLSCSNNEKISEYESLISEVNLKGKHDLILLPSEGCSGCLSSMKRFYLSNVDQFKLLLVYKDEREKLAYQYVNPELTKSAYFINQSQISIDQFDPNYPMIVEWKNGSPEFTKTDAGWFLK